MEDLLDAAGLDEIRRPLNGIPGNEGRSSARIVDDPNGPRSNDGAQRITPLDTISVNDGSR